jgi:hypothetical protein
VRLRRQVFRHLIGNVRPYRTVTAFHCSSRTFRHLGGDISDASLRCLTRLWNEKGEEGHAFRSAGAHSPNGVRDNQMHPRNRYRRNQPLKAEQIIDLRENDLAAKRMGQRRHQNRDGSKRMRQSPDRNISVEEFARRRRLQPFGIINEQLL